MVKEITFIQSVDDNDNLFFRELVVAMFETINDVQTIINRGNFIYWEDFPKIINAKDFLPKWCDKYETAMVRLKAFMKDLGYYTTDRYLIARQVNGFVEPDSDCITDTYGVIVTSDMFPPLVHDGIYGLGFGNPPKIAVNFIDNEIEMYLVYIYDNTNKHSGGTILTKDELTNVIQDLSVRIGCEVKNEYDFEKWGTPNDCCVIRVGRFEVDYAYLGNRCDFNHFRRKLIKTFFNDEE